MATRGIDAVPEGPHAAARHSAFVRLRAGTRLPRSGSRSCRPWPRRTRRSCKRRCWRRSLPRPTARLAAGWISRRLTTRRGAATTEAGVAGTLVLRLTTRRALAEQGSGPRCPMFATTRTNAPLDTKLSQSFHTLLLLESTWRCTCSHRCCAPLCTTCCMYHPFFRLPPSCCFRASASRLPHRQWRFSLVSHGVFHQFTHSECRAESLSLHACESTSAVTGWSGMSRWVVIKR